VTQRAAKFVGGFGPRPASRFLGKIQYPIPVGHVTRCEIVTCMAPAVPPLHDPQFCCFLEGEQPCNGKAGHRCERSATRVFGSRLRKGRNPSGTRPVGGRWSRPGQTKKRPDWTASAHRRSQVPGGSVRNAITNPWRFRALPSAHRASAG
jgi:hypothetical protein